VICGVHNSQILIAVWDKRRNGKPGGASAVVVMKLGVCRNETDSLGRTEAAAEHKATYFMM